MIDRDHDLPISKQAEVLRISRGSVYYLPRPVSAADLALMRRLDQLHLEFPFAGSRMLRGLVAAEGCKVGRRHVKTLMRRMGIEALYRRPRTTKPEPGHKIYPYLLRGLEITRPNQVWAMDITYIPMARGFVYLAVVLDWFSRRVLSWRLSITMEAAFCIEALQEAADEDELTAPRASSAELDRQRRARVHGECGAVAGGGRLPHECEPRAARSRACACEREQRQRPDRQGDRTLDPSIACPDPRHMSSPKCAG